MQNYVITGATGHLGNTVIKDLLKTEEEKYITILVLRGEDISQFQNIDNIDIRYGNILDKYILRKIIRKDSIVIHMAGIIDISNKNREKLYEVNIEGTRNMAEISREKGVKQFIYTSSVHVIPVRKGIFKSELLKEPTEFNSKFVVGDYAKSKTEATKIVFEEIKKGLNGIVLYPSGIIGPNDWKVSEMGQVILDIANKKLNVSVNGGYNFIDVRDVANSILLAIKNGKIGESYIISGNKINISTLYKIINKILKRKRSHINLSIWFIKIFAGLAEFHYKIRGLKPLFTRYSLYTLTSNHNFSNQKAIEELGLTIRSLEESITDTLKWFAEYKSELVKYKL